MSRIRTGWGIRVSRPALGDLDAGWLAVVCPGAGCGRGTVALPDTGDTVLVVLPRGEAASGLVLGSLLGANEPPDRAGVEDGCVRRWSLITGGGQSVVVDDAARSVRLADSSGSYLELGPDGTTMHAVTDLLLEAPGRAMTIRAASVDFVHASGDPA